MEIVKNSHQPDAYSNWETSLDVLTSVSSGGIGCALYGLSPIAPAGLGLLLASGISAISMVSVKKLLDSMEFESRFLKICGIIAGIAVSTISLPFLVSSLALHSFIFLSLEAAIDLAVISLVAKIGAFTAFKTTVLLKERYFSTPPDVKAKALDWRENYDGVIDKVVHWREKYSRVIAKIVHWQNTHPLAFKCTLGALIGIEACLITEHVRDTRLISDLWPGSPPIQKVIEEMPVPIPNIFTHPKKIIEETLAPIVAPISKIASSILNPSPIPIKESAPSPAPIPNIFTQPKKIIERSIAPIVAPISKTIDSTISTSEGGISKATIALGTITLLVGTALVARELWSYYKKSNETKLPGGSNPNRFPRPGKSYESSEWSAPSSANPPKPSKPSSTSSAKPAESSAKPAEPPKPSSTTSTQPTEPPKPSSTSSANPPKPSETNSEKLDLTDERIMQIALTALNVKSETEYAKILGVNSNYTPEDIKKAYRVKVLSFHSDKQTIYNENYTIESNRKISQRITQMLNSALDALGARNTPTKVFQYSQKKDLSERQLRPDEMKAYALREVLEVENEFQYKGMLGQKKNGPPLTHTELSDNFDVLKLRHNPDNNYIHDSNFSVETNRKINAMIFQWLKNAALDLGIEKVM